MFELVGLIVLANCLAHPQFKELTLDGNNPLTQGCIIQSAGDVHFW
jgi:hypothetical protein